MNDEQYLDWLRTRYWYRPSIAYPPQGTKHLSSEVMRSLLRMHGTYVSVLDLKMKDDQTWDQVLDTYLDTRSKGERREDSAVRELRAEGLSDDEIIEEGWWPGNEREEKRQRKLKGNVGSDLDDEEPEDAA